MLTIILGFRKLIMAQPKVFVRQQSRNVESVPGCGAHSLRMVKLICWHSNQSQALPANLFNDSEHSELRIPPGFYDLAIKIDLKALERREKGYPCLGLFILEPVKGTLH